MAEDEINQKLEQKMVAAFNEVYSVKQNQNVNAYCLFYGGN